MDELGTILDSPAPRTVVSLAADLRKLGVSSGMTLLVHSSLSALGWVVGGAQGAILALEQAVGKSGTLVMPAYSTDNSEPSYWKKPPVPEAWWPAFRKAMPAYDPGQSPTRNMGRIAELFRTWPGVRRSSHPALSFAAIGRGAQGILRGHGLEDAMGERSPLARLYDRSGYVLLLGVGHNRNSSLHLSEYRARWSGKTRLKQGAAMLVKGKRRWVSFGDLKLNADDFAQIGETFDASGGAVIGKVGNAICRLMPQRELVDFGVEWIERNRH